MAKYVVQVDTYMDNRGVQHTSSFCTLPLAWLKNMGVAEGDRNSRTVEVEYDFSAKEIRIKKAGV